MNKEDKYQKLDDILKELIGFNKKGSDTETMSNKVDIDQEMVIYLCDILITDMFIRHINTSSKDGRSYLIYIEPKGKLFLQIDGGYLAKHKNENLIKAKTTKDNNLNNFKIKTDIGKNLIFIITTAITVTYTIIDFFGEIIFNFDFTQFLIRLLNIV
jgi:hypothetical protein